MSTFSGYKTKAFSESQKFFVLDPQTGNPSFVQGSDLVKQLTPNDSYVFSEATRATAQATDYELGAVIHTGGATSTGDGQAGVYLVVPSGDGDLPMDNGLELLTLAGDDTLLERLALNTPGEGSDLIAHTGTDDTVTEAINSIRADLANPDMGAAMVAYQGGSVADKLDEIVSGADIGQSVGVSMSLTENTSACRRETEVDDINDIFPFNSIKLCNVKKTAWGSTLITYEGEPGFSRDGSNGEVMVEVPRHYLKRFIENGREYIYLSGTPLDGFAIDPAFVENGKELNSIYVGAYDGFTDENGMLRSITGKQATTGTSLPDFRVAANSLGDGFGLLDARTVFMLQRLFMVYFADRNAETSVGLGLVNFPWQSAVETLARATSNSSNTIIVYDAEAIRKFRVGMSVAVVANGEYYQLDDRKITAMNAVGSLTEITFSGPPVDVEEEVTRIYSQNQDSGMTDDVVGGTGMANKLGGFDGTEAVKWLHMENLWGNVWNMIDGIVVSDLVCYVGENTSDYSTTVGDEFKTTHKPLPLLVPLQDTNQQDDFETNNYFVKNLMLDKLNPAYAPPIQLGDGSNRFSGYCDPFYTRESGANIPAFGGGVDHIFRAGMFVWRFWYTSTSTTRMLCGARIMFRPV